jgi:hypothetical protein
MPLFIIAISSLGPMFLIALGVNKMISFFINRNENLKKLYSYNIKKHDENHYGTFDQFLQVLYSFRGKAGFELTFDKYPFREGKMECFPFTVKTEDGTEIDFAENLRIKITVDRRKEDPLSLGEPVWWVNPDGTKRLVGTKAKNTRIFEYFVFSSLREFYKFAQWTNAVHDNKLKFSNDGMLARSKENTKAKLDVDFNYWNLDKEAKKIFNMKERELDKVLKLDAHADDFAKLAKMEQLRQIKDGR